MIILYVLNYLFNWIWAPFAWARGWVDRDWKLKPWKNSDVVKQIHAIAYVYIFLELDAIENGGWIWD